MNTMSYKGYTARVEYDEHDNILVGRLLGIRSIISFHANTVAELRSEFERAVVGDRGAAERRPSKWLACHLTSRPFPVSHLNR